MIDRRLFLGAAAAFIAACAPAAKATPIQVYKAPTCGCCSGWVDHLSANGFEAHVTDLEDVSPVARRLRVPDELRSCHTAEVGGYFIEGHVPAADIRRLLKDRPKKAIGLAVPGMPVGSPGMEQGGFEEPYATLIVDVDRHIRRFADHGV